MKAQDSSFWMVPGVLRFLPHHVLGCGRRRVRGTLTGGSSPPFVPFRVRVLFLRFLRRSDIASSHATEAARRDFRWQVFLQLHEVATPAEVYSVDLALQQKEDSHKDWPTWARSLRAVAKGWTNLPAMASSEKDLPNNTALLELVRLWL